MRKINALFVAFAVASFSVGALADGQVHQLTGGTTAGLSFGTDFTSISATTGYRYLVMPEFGLQVGADVTFTYSKVGTTKTTAFAPLAAVRVNYPSVNVREAFWLEPLVGLSLSDNGTATTTKFAFGGRVGKNFELFQNVAYSPSAAVTKVVDSNALFTVTPVAFSLYF